MSKWNRKDSGPEVPMDRTELDLLSKEEIAERLGLYMVPEQNFKVTHERTGKVPRFGIKSLVGTALLAVTEVGAGIAMGSNNLEFGALIAADLVIASAIVAITKRKLATAAVTAIALGSAYLGSEIAYNHVENEVANVVYGVVGVAILGIAAKEGAKGYIRSRKERIFNKTDRKVSEEIEIEQSVNKASEEGVERAAWRQIRNYQKRHNFPSSEKVNIDLYYAFHAIESMASNGTKTERALGQQVRETVLLISASGEAVTSDLVREVKKNVMEDYERQNRLRD